MDDSRVLRNRTVGRNTASNYRDIIRIRPSPYPLTTSSPTQSTSTFTPRRTSHRTRLSLSPQKSTRLSLSPTKRSPTRQSPTRQSPTHSSDRFIPYSASAITLRHLLTSPPPRSQRDGSQSPTNPQLHSPGKRPEWPNSYDESLHSHRLASALEIPISSRILHFHSQPPSPKRSPVHSPHTLLPALLDPPDLVKRQQRKRAVPPEPFRVLDAPDMRDDYYAQPLSWSITGTLAVALGMDVYLSTTDGVIQLPLSSLEDVTSISFNPAGDILAIATADGSVLLHSPTESSPRLIIAPLAEGTVGALSWRPPHNEVNTNELLIGAADGRVFLCAVTWDRVATVEQRGIWDDVHDDQICGIAWSNDGLCFATGGNDNKVCTFEGRIGKGGWEKRFEWVHDAAVKALAFKSGKGGVLAAGGGVSDKKIRFYNTHTGVIISSLDVSAQITSLIWSPSTTEILATFGYTAPGIRTKCAVYAYPSLQCLFSFDIADEIRVLYAVLAPNGRDVVVAGSDECIRFYEIWGGMEREEGSPLRDEIEERVGNIDLEERRRGFRYGLSVIR